MTSDATSGPPVEPVLGDGPRRVSRTARREAERRRRAQRRALVAVVAIVVVAVLAAATVVVHERRSRHRRAAAAAPPSASVAPPAAGFAALPLAASAAATGEIGAAKLTDAGTIADIESDTQTAVQTVDSYDYRHLGRDLALGNTVTTGQFEIDYHDAMTGTIASAAPAAQTIQQCIVQDVGVTSMPDAQHATALVFALLEKTDAKDATPATTAVTLSADLVLVQGSWRIAGMTQLSTGDGPQASPPGNTGLASAVHAGAQETVNLLTYGRATFAADFQRAIEGLDAALAGQQRAKQAQLQSTMTSGGFDYRGTVSALAVVSAAPSSVELLELADGYQQTDSGQRILSSSLRLDVQVDFEQGRWLVTRFQPVASS